MMNRGHRERLNDSRGSMLAEVQRSRLVYCEEGCSRFSASNRSGSIASELGAQWMMEASARRGMVLRLLVMDR